LGKAWRAKGRIRQNGNPRKTFIFVNDIFTFASNGFHSRVDISACLAHIPDTKLSDPTRIADQHRE
jgi:hypothetical protein